MKRASCDIAADPSRSSVLRRITSPRPTPYRVLDAGGEARFLFCAFDALLYTHLTGQALCLEARPPAGAAFSLAIEPEHPPTEPYWQGYVSPRTPLPEAPGMASSRCPYLHLFARLEDARAWHATLPTDIAAVVTLIPLAEAWERARGRVLKMTQT